MNHYEQIGSFFIVPDQLWGRAVHSWPDREVMSRRLDFVHVGNVEQTGSARQTRSLLHLRHGAKLSTLSTNLPSDM